MEQSLTVTERQELESHEVTIEHGLETFVEVGTALAAIRDGRLYRAEYGTFEEYLDRRWQMTPRHARRLMSAADTVNNLTLGPIGPKVQTGTMFLDNPATWPPGFRMPRNEAQVRPLVSLEPEQQREAWQRAIDTAPNGEPTAAHVESVVELFKERRPASQPVQVTIFSSESNEYYTPSLYVEAAREVLGGIDLDPASCESAQVNIKAGRFFTIADDGLKQEWHGSVWLNPPYGVSEGESNQGAWARKLIDEYKAGRVNAGILLVKAALGYNWFENLWYDWPACFARERLSFIKADGTSDGQSKQGTAFFYFGPNFDLFEKVFRRFGRVIKPEREEEWLSIVQTLAATVT